MSERVTRRLRIHGRVQGVFYRDSMRAEAAALGIAGWVRNRADGTVEALVQGDPVAIAAIVAWARRGPDQARVTRVDESAAEGDYAGFERRPTE